MLLPNNLFEMINSEEGVNGLVVAALTPTTFEHNGETIKVTTKKATVNSTSIKKGYVADDCSLATCDPDVILLWSALAARGMVVNASKVYSDEEFADVLLKINTKASNLK